MKIYKHVLSVVILSEQETLEDALGGEWDLKDVEYAITDGDCIGDVQHESTEMVPASKVVSELIAIGNDGSFFGDLDDED